MKKGFWDLMTMLPGIYSPSAEAAMNPRQKYDFYYINRQGWVGRILLILFRRRFVLFVSYMLNRAFERKIINMEQYHDMAAIYHRMARLP